MCSYNYMKQLIILSMLLIACACSSPSCEDEVFELIGSWELVQFCFSPGDASCPIQTPTEDEIIEFRSDSTFTLSIGDSTTLGTFSISNRLIEYRDSFGSIIQQRVILETSRCRLEMGPLCFEACREYYEKI